VGGLTGEDFALRGAGAKMIWKKVFYEIPETNIMILICAIAIFGKPFHAVYPLFDIFDSP